MSDRDTHFLGFAKLLYEELAQNVVHTELRPFAELEAFKHEQHTIIARRAYDLIIHAVTHAPPADLNIFHQVGGSEEWPWPQFFQHIPDLTSWPAPQSETPTV